MVEGGNRLHAASGNALHVAIHAGGRLQHVEQVLLALGPLPQHESLLLLQFLLLGAEVLNDGIDPVLEMRAGEIVVHLLHLPRLPHLLQLHPRNVEEVGADDRSQRQRLARMHHMHGVNHIETFHTLGQGGGHKHRHIGRITPLVVAELGEPALAPVLGPLQFPDDGAGGLARRGQHLLHEVRTDLALGYGRHPVHGEAVLQLLLEIEFQHFPLQLL